MSKQPARYFYSDFVPRAVYRLANNALTIYGDDGSSRQFSNDRNVIDWITVEYTEITEENAVKRLNGLRPWEETR